MGVSDTISFAVLKNLIKKNFYSFIWLCQVFLEAPGVFFGCGMQALSGGMWDLVP